MKIERLQALALDSDPDQAIHHLSNPNSKRLLHQIIERARSTCVLEEFASSIKIPQAIDPLIKDAENLVSLGITAEAELLLITIALFGPLQAAATTRLAELYESDSAYERTVSLAKLLLEYRGQNAEATYQLSFALYKLGRSDEALEYLLPYYACAPTQRSTRLCGLLLKSLGKTQDAIELLTKAIESDPSDIHSLKAISEAYTEIGMYQKGLDSLKSIPEEARDVTIKIYEAIIHRFMGNNEYSIEILSQILEKNHTRIDVMWPLCFNYSIAGIAHAHDLLRMAKKYWNTSGYLASSPESPHEKKSNTSDRQIRLGLLTSDIGEHVVSRFMTPLLRNYDRERFSITLLNTARRFEQKGIEISSLADCAFSLQALSLSEARKCIRDLELDIIIDMNGFTKNSGLHILGLRCAPIQCHYIGYHATTGLETIDYFLGDPITTPNEFRQQFSEEIIQIPRLWMAYDAHINFPKAVSKSTRQSPVFGAFSQITKINNLTAEYWAAAMLEVPDSILVIKDRGALCDASRKRIEDTMEVNGIDPSRVYFFGPVGSHEDHLDSYNAIDIALDTTPWSGATTAFEALGMGVPLVAICGKTTSSRMSTSVVHAAGRGHWIASNQKDFARIAAELAGDYKQIRHNKAILQTEIRASILFDEQRIAGDFYSVLEQLIARRKRTDGT